METKGVNVLIRRQLLKGCILDTMMEDTGYDTDNETFSRKILFDVVLLVTRMAIVLAPLESSDHNHPLLDVCCLLNYVRLNQT